jgi:DNA-directed RNA polymerase specialized sigma24 family protein
MNEDGRNLAGDFDSFFRGVFPKTVAVAQRITGDRGSAEDAAVEALAKAHVRWKRIGGQPWRQAWVFKVAVNEAIRRLPRPDPAGPAPSDGDLADYVAVGQTLTAALRQLPRRQCEVIVLRYLLDFSEAETVVEALDPLTMVAVTGGPSLKPVAEQAASRLRAALAALPSPP